MIPERHRNNPDRRFQVFPAPSGWVFVIQEIDENSPEYSRHDLTRIEAWQVARSQVLPVVFVSKKGRHHPLGRVFDPRVFERLVFEYFKAAVGTVQKFDEWVETFRKSPSWFLDACPDFLKNSQERYEEMFGTRGDLSAV